VPIDNLPVPSQTEIEDKVFPIIRDWSPRTRLTALKQLYVICQTRIGDINHEIGKARDAEIKEKQRQG